MSKIAIFGDTAQDLTIELAKNHGIELIPYKLEIDGKSYIDQVEIQSREFYQGMDSYNDLKTGTPGLQLVIEVLDRLKEENYTDAIMITCSSKLTGMYNVYNSVKHMYEGINLHLIETDQIASSTALVTIYAAQLRDEGYKIDEILERINNVLDKVNIFALFRTLTYVARGGRFNKYKGMLGNLLNIQPLLTPIDGEVGIISRSRGKKKSQNTLVESVKEYIGDSKNYWLSIFSADNDKELSEIREKLKDEFAKAKFVLKSELTPMLGVHSGPKAVGVGILKFD